MQKCASPSCNILFDSLNRKNIHCSFTCRNREYQRRYREKRTPAYLAKKRRWSQKNKARIYEKRKARYKADPAFARSVQESKRNTSLKTLYGLSIKKKNDLLMRQGGKCANSGCKTDEPGSQGWHVDHDHATGRVRGLLCRGCNLALGLLGENSEKIIGLSRYLNVDV